MTTLEDVFREHWGRVVAVLMGLLGDLDPAEDAAAKAALLRASAAAQEVREVSEVRDERLELILTMAQRLVRAKRKIRNAGIPFGCPRQTCCPSGSTPCWPRCT